MEQTSQPKVRMAAKNQVAGVRTFYVQSDSDPETEYMVVEIKRNGKTIYFCQCGSFFGRNLPFLGLNIFQHCKHGQLVKDTVSRG